MEYRTLGRTGLIVSAFGLGSMQFGQGMNMGSLDQAATTEMVRFALDHGALAWTTHVSGSARPGLALLRAAQAMSPASRMIDGVPSSLRSNTNIPVQHGCDLAINAIRVMEKS